MTGLGPVQTLAFDDPLRFNRAAPPSIVVIFGANGDLTKRKLLPALYRLAQERRLPPSFAILGLSRTAMTDDRFREKMRDGVEKFLEDSPFDTELWNSFAQGLFYVDGDLGAAETYQKLSARLGEISREISPSLALSFWYVSAAPRSPST